MNVLALNAIKVLLEKGFSPKDIEILLKKKVITKEIQKILETYKPGYKPNYERR